VSCIFLFHVIITSESLTAIINFSFIIIYIWEEKLLKSAKLHVNFGKSQTNIDIYLNNYKYFLKRGTEWNIESVMKIKNIYHRCKGSHRTSYPTFTCGGGIKISKKRKYKKCFKMI